MTEYIVTGTKEGEWFLEKMTMEEIEEWLEIMTAQEKGSIDTSKVDKKDIFGVESQVYEVGMTRFVIIDGDRKEIEAKEVITELDLV